MATRDIDSGTLNNLIATMIDAVGGDGQAAVPGLRAKVTAPHGNPEDDGTLLASAHRTFLRLKSAFGGNQKAVFNEAEIGEDHIEARHDEALRETRLPEPRRVIARASGSARKDHDSYSAMKHPYAG